MFAIVICFVFVMCTLTIWISIMCVLMVEGMSVAVNVMLSLISVMSPPPALCDLSLRTVVKLCILGVLALEVSLVSWMVMMSACVSCMSVCSSSSLFCMPFTLTCSIMRFFSLLLLGLCVCLSFVCSLVTLCFACFACVFVVMGVCCVSCDRAGDGMWGSVMGGDVGGVSVCVLSSSDCTGVGDV